MKPNGFPSPLPPPPPPAPPLHLSAHSRHSRCACAVEWGKSAVGRSAIVLLGAGGGSDERLIRFDERCAHAWAPMSPAMRQLCSRASRLRCHLLNDEVQGALLALQPRPLRARTHTRAHTAVWPCVLYNFDCILTQCRSEYQLPLNHKLVGHVKRGSM